jgi:Fe-S cluster assembly protein SufB
MDTALREYPDVVKKHMGKIIPRTTTSSRAQLGCVERWIVHLSPAGRQGADAVAGVLPHQLENMGQFERTLIIADEGSEVHYIEGCSAPVYTTDSLHSAVVEILVGKSLASPTRPFKTGRTTSSTS